MLCWSLVSRITIRASCISIMGRSLAALGEKRLTAGLDPWSPLAPMEPVRVLDRRGGLVECEHSVRVAVWKDRKLAAAAGHIGSPVYLRSSAKPVQALACILTGA